jgi:competence protein ComEC
MSFAATAALIAAYGWYAEHRRELAADGRQRELPAAWRIARFGLLFLGGLATTSLIAGTATGLYAAWHFQRVAPLGLVANLLAMPVVTVAVMPTAVAGTVLAPFGLDGPFFTVMGWGLSWVIAVAEWVAAHSPVDAVGLIPPSAVVVLSIALAMATVATSWLRVAAVPLLVAGIALIAMRELPDALLDEDGRLVALRMSQGRIAVNRARPSSFTMENWSRALAASSKVRPMEGAMPDEGEQPFFCADGLCMARHPGGAVVATAATADAAKAACGRAALIVIDDATARNPCGHDDMAAVISKKDLARKGSAAVSFGPDGRAEITFAVRDGDRPWHYQRRYSREARGMPPYQRKARERPTDNSPADAKPTAPETSRSRDNSMRPEQATKVSADARAISGAARASPVNSDGSARPDVPGP